MRHRPGVTDSTDDGPPTRTPGGRLGAWGQLLRLPNLPTVPGDPIVGYLLAASSAGMPVTAGIVLPALASTLLYCAGLLANDYFDLAEDRRHRPTRPLPAGFVRPATAIAVAAALTALGLAAAWGAGTAAAIAALVLAGAVWGYDLGLKRLAVVGPVVMGTCRGLSLLLGAVAAVGWHLPGAVVASACGLTAYIAAVTVVAARETTPGRVGPSGRLPLLVLIVWIWILWPLLLVGSAANVVTGLPVASLTAVALGLAARQAVRLGRQLTPRAKQRAVGSLLAALPVVQAALASVAYATAQSQRGLYLVLALALAAGWPAAILLARRFHAS